jgi:hypothetical protein
MHAVLKTATGLAVLVLGAATLAGCVVSPAEPYYGGGAYYAKPAPVYVAPRTYYGGSRWSTWHRHRWHGNRNHWH